MKINILNKTQTEYGFKVQVAVTDGAKELLSKIIDATSAEDLCVKLTDLKDKVNSNTIEMEKVSLGEYTTFAPEKVLTPEEIKEEEIAQKRYELNKELERAKKDAEIADLAKTDSDLAEKLQEFKAIAD